MYVLRSANDPAIIANSRGMRSALESCHKAARENGPVLFLGEIGTGKLLLATYLHRLNSRADKPFLIIDCTDPQDRITDLLDDQNCFGNKLKFLAGGTLYLQEIASLDLQQQATLHEICLQAETYKIRVFASSIQNIHLLMYDKAFDSNLYQYFSQREVFIPPLRQRREDLPAIIEHFISILNSKLRKAIQGLTPQVEQLFLNYRWPENVEEVKHILTRAMILANEPFIGQRHLTEYLGQLGEDEKPSYDVMPLERMEEILLTTALNRYGYTLEGKKRAARALNISLATLYNKVKRYNLKE